MRARRAQQWGHFRQLPIGGEEKRPSSLPVRKKSSSQRTALGGGKSHLLPLTKERSPPRADGPTVNLLRGCGRYEVYTGVFYTAKEPSTRRLRIRTERSETYVRPDPKHTQTIKKKEIRENSSDPFQKSFLLSAHTYPELCWW